MSLVVLLKLYTVSAITSTHPVFWSVCESRKREHNLTVKFTWKGFQSKATWKKKVIHLKRMKLLNFAM